MTEPNWLNQSLQNDQLRIERSQYAPTGAVSVYTQPSGEWVDANDDLVTIIDLPNGTNQWMLKIGERWLARRFSRDQIAP